MPRITFLFCFFFIFQVFSQEQTTYKDYNLLTSKAISSTLDSNYTEAFKAYSEAFESFDFCFPRDLLVGAQVAALLDKKEACVSWIDKSIVGGVSIEKFEYIPLLKPFAHSISKERLRKLFDERDNRIDWELKRNIDEAYLLDQKLRAKDQAFFSNRFFVWRKKLRRRWMNNLYGFMKSIDSVTAIKGFPSERLIGIDSTSLFVHAGNFYSMLYHYDSTYSVLESTLNKALDFGYIHIRDFAILRDFEYRREKPQSHPLNLSYFFGVRWADLSAHTTEEIELLDRHRYEIGLYKFEYEIKMKKAQNSFNYYSKTSPTPMINYFYYEL